eukprot:1437743-Lingulodinium_polyedra.AAC.1
MGENRNRSADARGATQHARARARTPAQRMQPAINAQTTSGHNRLANPVQQQRGEVGKPRQARAT